MDSSHLHYNSSSKMLLSGRNQRMEEDHFGFPMMKCKKDVDMDVVRSLTTALRSSPTDFDNMDKALTGSLSDADVSSQMHAEMSAFGNAPVTKTQKESAGAKTFPEKLMSLLSKSILNPEIAESISWLPHGRSFVVCNPDKFEREVLPTYFKQAKYSSFTRKLYRWGFRHITKGPDANSFYHEQFQRDNAKMCLNMYCTYSDGVVRNKRAKMNSKLDTLPKLSSSSSKGKNFFPDSFDAMKGNHMMPEEGSEGGEMGSTVQMQLQMQKLQMQKLEMQKMQLQLQRMQMQIQMNAKMMGINPPENGGAPAQPPSSFPESFGFDLIEDDYMKQGGSIMPQHMGTMMGMKPGQDQFQGVNQGIMKSHGVLPMQSLNEPTDKVSHIAFQQKLMAAGGNFVSKQAYIAKLRQQMAEDGNRAGHNSAMA